VENAEGPVSCVRDGVPVCQPRVQDVPYTQPPRQQGRKAADNITANSGLQKNKVR
jgi:hypothetical protein